MGRVGEKKREGGNDLIIFSLKYIQDNNDTF